MIVKTKLTEQDYINASYVLMYNKTSTRISTGIRIIIFVCGILFIPSIFLTQQGFLILIVLLIPPALYYFSFKRTYHSNQRISEPIEYEFERDNFFSRGESFSSHQSWGKIYKVTETRNWLLIYQNAQIANPVPKRDIPDGVLTGLKLILDEHRVKNNLKG